MAQVCTIYTHFATIGGVFVRTSEGIVANGILRWNRHILNSDFLDFYRVPGRIVSIILGNTDKIVIKSGGPDSSPSLGGCGWDMTTAMGIL